MGTSIWSGANLLSILLMWLWGIKGNRKNWKVLSLQLRRLLSELIVTNREGIKPRSLRIGLYIQESSGISRMRQVLIYWQLSKWGVVWSNCITVSVNWSQLLSPHKAKMFPLLSWPHSTQKKKIYLAAQPVIKNFIFEKVQITTWNYEKCLQRKTFKQIFDTWSLKGTGSQQGMTIT